MEKERLALDKMIFDLETLGYGISLREHPALGLPSVELNVAKIGEWQSLKRGKEAEILFKEHGLDKLAERTLFMQVVGCPDLNIEAKFGFSATKNQPFHNAGTGRYVIIQADRRSATTGFSLFYELMQGAVGIWTEVLNGKLEAPNSVRRHFEEGFVELDKRWRKDPTQEALTRSRLTNLGLWGFDRQGVMERIRELDPADIKDIYDYVYDFNEAEVGYGFLNHQMIDLGIIILSDTSQDGSTVIHTNPGRMGTEDTGYWRQISAMSRTDLRARKDNVHARVNLGTGNADDKLGDLTPLPRPKFRTYGFF